MRAAFALAAFATLVAGAAPAQQYQDTWASVCEPAAQGEVCYAGIWTQFRDDRLYLKARDDGANSFFRAHMPRVDLRIVQIALRPLDKVFDLVCRGETCEADRAMARAILDGLPGTREIQARVVAGNALGAVVRIESSGYGLAQSEAQRKK